MKVSQWVLLLGIIGLLLWPHQVLSADKTYIKHALIDGQQVQRWSNDTRIIYVAMSPGNTIQDWKPQMTGLLQSAFKDWEKALDNKIVFLYTKDPKLIDVEVKWRNKQQGTQLGHQEVMWKNNTLMNANLIISVHNDKGRQFTSKELKAIMLHEIGHLLGIRGHSPYQYDIMFASHQPSVYKISARDKATIQKLYSMAPHITNPKGIHLAQYRQYDYYIDIGAKANNKKRYEDAFRYFQKAAGYYPQSPDINYYQGLAAYNSKLYGPAINYLSKAHKQQTSSNQAEIQFYLAQSYLLNGELLIKSGLKPQGKEAFKLANQHFKQVIRNPKLSTSLRNIAIQNQKLILSKKIG